MKTSERTGFALDWAVAECEGGKWCSAYTPSTNWAQGGPIIEREKIELEYGGPEWWACIKADDDFSGPTPLIAAMRCYVASVLGNEVEIPQELVT